MPSGTITWDATAVFYEGLNTLPDDFKRGELGFSPQMKGTHTEPLFEVEGTAPVSEVFKHSWP